MNTQVLTQEDQMASALIIDDAFDQIPRAEDLAEDEALWTTFFDDMGDNRTLIEEAFPQFSEMSADELRHSNAFVAKLWEIRDQLPANLTQTLFDEYERSIAADRIFLAALQEKLRELGITPTATGRETNQGQQDIYFVDLFLGAAQAQEDITRSISVVKALIADRPQNPPLVVLMSRSRVLGDHSKAFRDDASLLGAMFRVHSKDELIADGSLERILSRLASHWEDAKRVANFVFQLQEGFDGAKDRFLKTIRRLDLSDYARIQELLLNREGQPIGSYMLDVFDRVLQYEIEGNEATIDAARNLNQIDAKRYPFAYVTGTPDTQDLVYRTLWQHPTRLKIKTTVADMPVGFGDLLVKKSFFAGETNPVDLEVLVVMTPACDLVREDGAKSVLFLTGQLLDLTHKNWTYAETPLRTPIIILPGNKRMWIRWDVKSPKTFRIEEIAALTNDQGSHRIAMRFRESQAIELQQRLLADLGRVGLIAKMPATFPVKISAAYMKGDGTLVPLALPKAAEVGAVCYSGQDNEGEEFSKLVLTEPVIDELLLAISGIDPADVHTRAKTALDALKGQTDLPQKLQSGLKIQASDNYVALQVDHQKDGQRTAAAVGYIARNPNDDAKPNVKNAALVITVKDDVAG